MPFKHNKKRNIGLLSEFFSRYIANALIEKRYKDIDKAKKIWTEFCNSNSEIHKELTMFNALYSSNLKSREIGFSLLENVKKACKTQNQRRLDEEKSRLIDAITLQLKDPKFFDREIPEYKNYANVQILMNSWRGIGFKGSINEISQLEDTVLQEMLTEKKTINESSVPALEMTNEDIDGLVIKLMTEKANEKFERTLTSGQQQLVKLYVLAGKSQDTERKLKSLMESIRNTTETSILESLKNPKNIDNKVSQKLEKVLGMLKEESNKAVSDDSIMFHMTLDKLKEELKS
jgi:hypothetical protein